MIDDFRDRRGLKHELWVCLILILIGYLCGKNTMCGIERYLKIRERELRKILPLYGEQGQGIPSHNTLSRIMEKLSFGRLHHVFLLWIDDLTSDIADDRGQICADGKGIRAARPGGSETRVPYVLNALLDMKDVIRLYVALRKVGLKTNEIKILPDFLNSLSLTTKQSRLMQSELRPKLSHSLANGVQTTFCPQKATRNPSDRTWKVISG